MEFGEADFNLLTKLKEITTAADWDQLMELRLTVIHSNVVYTEGGGGAEAKETYVKSRVAYEEYRAELQKKYV